ncbi:mechanosensitive ion channel family protein [Candidatus Neomarinimicrobiota bacterium]
MDRILDYQFAANLIQIFMGWLQEHVLVIDSVIQVSVILILFLVSGLFGRRLRPHLPPAIAERLRRDSRINSFLNMFSSLLSAVYFLVFLGISVFAFRQLDLTPRIIILIVTLLTAWIVIKLASAVILNPSWSRYIAAGAWTLAALNILGILGPIIRFLDTIGFSFGTVDLTVLSLLTAALFLVVALRIGRLLSDYLQNRLLGFTPLSASARVLYSKIVKTTVYILVIMIALSSVGIDFSAFAFFGGAIGVGLGFGLQKVVSNFISGIILLTDESIKPGDVIQVGTVYGWISSLRGRYVSVVTREGHEYLIPNEDLITQQVVNWSYTDRKVRLTLKAGISYKSDVHLAMSLLLEAAKDMERVLQSPKPLSLLTEFGDSSVDLELRFWIDDPKNGIGNIKSAILLKVWDLFKENGIEIPFPQRDLHFIEGKAPIQVRLTGENPSP